MRFPSPVRACSVQHACDVGAKVKGLLEPSGYRCPTFSSASSELFEATSFLHFPCPDSPPTLWNLTSFPTASLKLPFQTFMLTSSKANPMALPLSSDLSNCPTSLLFYHYTVCQIWAQFFFLSFCSFSLLHQLAGAHAPVPLLSSSHYIFPPSLMTS